MSGSLVILLEQQFSINNEAYNFYNAYARNRGFDRRRKEINKSRRPPHEVICRNFIATRRVWRSWLTKDNNGLRWTVVLILEFSVLLRCMYICVYYQTEDFGLSPSLLIRIHMIYQARIRSITFTLIRHIIKDYQKHFDQFDWCRNSSF